MTEQNIILELQQKYQKILLADGGLKTLCNALIEDVKNPVFILDRYQDDTMYLAEELKKDIQFYEYLAKRKVFKKEEIFKQNGWVIERVGYRWQEEEVFELQIKLKHSDETLGFLVVLEKEKVAEVAYLSIMQAAYAFSLKLHQNYIVRRLARKCNSELIEDIVNGRVKEKEELIKRGELAGWDLSLNYQLFLFKINRSEIYDDNNKGTTLYYYELQEQIIRNLHRIIKTYIRRKYLIFVYNDQVVLLINYPEKDNEIREDIDSIYQKIQAAFNKIDIKVAGGNYTTDCRDISASFKQASYALDFLDNMEVSDEILFYQDLGVLRLLWKLDKKELTNFANEYLAQLINYDDGNNDEWLKTLNCFLEEDSDIKASAERLNIHPNTMRYRINRLEEILDFKLDNFEIKLNLAIAYKIYQYIDL